MRTIRAIATFLFLAAASWAQSPITASQVNIPLTPILTPITSANLNVVGGAPGNATYYYWIVTQFLLGPSQPVLMGVVNNAPNTLGASNYVAIVPQFTGAALTADVLRTTSPIAPSGVCNCAVTTGATSSSTIKDTSNSLGAYTVLAAIAPASYQISLTNQVEAAGITHLILQQGNTVVADLSISSTTYFSGVPSGNCINTSSTAELAINQSNGNVYYCNATPGNIGTWAQIASAVGSAAFSAVTAGTNTAALLIGTGGSLGTSGSGTIQATSNTGNSATATALAAVPTQCSGVNFGTGIAANGNANCAQPGFAGIAAGSNTGALTIGTGGSLAPTGTGTITANQSTGTQIAQTGVDINTTFQVTSLHLSSPLGISQGGLGLTSGTSGGILGFTASNVLASSGVLSIGGVIVGGGSGALPSSTTMLGTDTSKLPGATWDAQLNYCLNTLVSQICNMHALSNQGTLTSGTTPIAIPGNSLIILPHNTTLHFSNGFTFNFTGGPNYALVCIENDWQCILDASNNGSAGIVNAGASYGVFQGWQGIGGRLLGQSGLEFVATSSIAVLSHIIVDHVQILQAGSNAFTMTNCNYCGFQNNSEADSPNGVGFNLNSNGVNNTGDFIRNCVVQDANEGSLAGNGDINVQSTGGDLSRDIDVSGCQIKNGKQYGGSGTATFTNGSNTVTSTAGTGFTTGSIWVGWHLVVYVGKVPYDYQITSVANSTTLNITLVGSLSGFQQASGSYQYEVYAPAAWPIIAESQGYATSSGSVVTWASHSGTDLKFVYDTATFTGSPTIIGNTAYFTCTSSCNVLPGVYTVSGNSSGSLNGSCTVPYASHGTFLACTYSSAPTTGSGGSIAGSPWNNSGAGWAITFQGGGTFPITAVTSSTTLTVTGTPGIGAATVFTVTPTPSIYDTGASEGIQVLDKTGLIDVHDNNLFNIGSEGIVCGDTGGCMVHHNIERDIGMTTTGTGCNLQSIQTPNVGGQANITVAGTIIQGNQCTADSSFGVPNGGVQTLNGIANQNGSVGYGIWSNVGSPTTGSSNFIIDQNYCGNNFSVVGYGSMINGFEYTNSATGVATVTLINDLLCDNTFSASIINPINVTYDAFTIGTWQLANNLVGGYSTNGVGVDLSNPTTLPASDRNALILNTGSGATSLTLPAATGAFASNFPFLLDNTNSPAGNISLTPTTPNNIDGGAAQAPTVVLPFFGAFTYQDSAAIINWHTVRFPTFQAFGASCANGMTWSTTTGFGCQPSAPVLVAQANTYTGAGAAGTQTFVTGTGTNPAFNFTGNNTNTGFFGNGVNGSCWAAAGTASYCLGQTSLLGKSTSAFGFTSGSATVAPDTLWTRKAAGQVSFDDGTGGDSKGNLITGGYASGGTTFTASGCSNSTLVGGASAGSFNSGTTGTCTVTITMGNSFTAAHGFSCWANDVTTPADKINQTGGSTTTAILSGTTASGDVINFGCMAY